MSGNFWLDWAILALSVFNTIVMLWLGLMVIFSAEKRSAGVYLAGSGLIAGSIFFLSHAALIGQNITLFSAGINFWWHLGWAPVIAAPFAWYVVMLWFSGYWSENRTRIRGRHQPWLYICIVYAALLFFLFVFFNPFGDLTRAQTLNYDNPIGFTRLPLLFITYPVFILLCIILSMDALIRPAPSQRMMGESAREKARPWLVGSGFLLLLAALTVGYTIGWVSSQAKAQSSLLNLFSSIAETLAWIDLAISILITIAVILVGQAIVSYEIFTGKPMPRSGFMSQWILILIISSGLAILTSFMFELEMKRIYLLMFSVIISAGLFALFTWQVNVDRDNTFKQLRYILSAGTLLDKVLSGQSNVSIRTSIDSEFSRLISDLLNLECGIFVPGQIYTQLEIPWVTYPESLQVDQQKMLALINGSRSGENPGEFNFVVDGIQFRWIIPIISNRGVDGWLILGNKSSRGFITLEEIEIGRSAAERMADAWVSATLARKLVLLQRERFTDQILIEQRPRRIIHDDVLPLLHAAMLHNQSTESELKNQTNQELSKAHKMLSDLIRQMPSYQLDQFETRSIEEAIQIMANNEFKSAFSELSITADMNIPKLEQKITTSQKEVVYFAVREAVRNAARYANPSDGDQLPSLSINLRDDEGLLVEIIDNGKGTVQPSQPSIGNGQGLVIHSLLVSIFGGKMQIANETGTSNKVTIFIPVYR